MNIKWIRSNKYAVHHTNKSQQYTNFHPNRLNTLCEMIGAEMFAFLDSYDLESRARSVRPVSKYSLSSYQV